MKKILVVIILMTVCAAHAQTDDKAALTQLNEKVFLSYQNKQFDETLKFAQQAVELSIKIYGNENQETAFAYSNLGAIYRQKNKYRESADNYQKAVEIYQKFSGSKSKDLINAYEKLAYAQFLAGKEKEAEASYLKAVEAAENEFGKESKESFSPILNAANFYAGNKKYEKADEFYLKSYAVAIKNFDKKGKETEQIAASRLCFLSLSGYNKERQEEFNEAVKKLAGEDAQTSPIINGKAKSLPKPTYPSSARSRGASGVIAVKVKIDLEGNVIEAKALCGDPDLRKAAETAAGSAKFSGGVLPNGKPSEISGFIVYNFVF